MTNSVRTRMAPSPTGEIHIGSMAIVLKNYAFAKKHNGQFILRIEDTDKEREVAGAGARLMDTIRAFGLQWDEGPDIGGPHAPYLQSERLELYKHYAEQLVADGKAYYCFCSKEQLEASRARQIEQKIPPKYDRSCRDLTAEEVNARRQAGETAVVRLKVPDDTEVTFTDLIRGTITTPSNSVDDQVLLKSDGYPTYHLAVVVDDHLMQISHILRGEEWISSTPKHVLLYQAFGWEQPIFAHIPVFLNPDGKGKMSKRKGTVSAQSFLDQGYLIDALRNFLMILGWAPKDQREILTLVEYVAEFDLTDISAKSVVFDLEKLRWINGVYIRSLAESELIERLAPFIPVDFPPELLKQVLPLIKERLVILSDFDELTSFFYRPIELDPALLLKKAESPELVVTQLEVTIKRLETLANWNHEEIDETLRALQAEFDWKKSQYFMMIRVAATGRAATPPLFETLAVMGSSLVIQRLQAASQLITAS